MKLSHQGLLDIASFEGFRSHVYNDGWGTWTIGYGTTRNKHGQPLTRNTPPITREHALTLLRRDAAGVERVVRRRVKVPLNQCEFDALCSLGYNIGEAGLAGSTVIKALNRRRRVAAGAAFMLWVRPAALIGRRRLERLRFRGRAGRACGARHVV